MDNSDFQRSERKAREDSDRAWARALRKCESENDKLRAQLSTVTAARDAAVAALSAWQDVFGTTQLTHAAARLQQADRNLGNLLAVIFGDGGQRQSEINDDAKAVEEAKAVIHGLYAALKQTESMGNKRFVARMDSSDFEPHAFADCARRIFARPKEDSDTLAQYGNTEGQNAK